MPDKDKVCARRLIGLAVPRAGDPIWPWDVGRPAVSTAAEPIRRSVSCSKHQSSWHSAAPSTVPTAGRQGVTMEASLAVSMISVVIALGALVVSSLVAIQQVRQMSQQNLLPVVLDAFRRHEQRNGFRLVTGSLAIWLMNTPRIQECRACLNRPVAWLALSVSSTTTGASSLRTRL
jgi:hypothetical protein